MKRIDLIKNIRILKEIQEYTARINPSTQQEIVAASIDIDSVVRHASAQTQEMLRSLHRTARLVRGKTRDKRILISVSRLKSD